ncbi:MAG: CbtA family protein, partial [Rickettsiales bacterium]
MFGRILVAAVISGLLAGVAFTGLQAVKVLPLIWAAEAYEGAEATPAVHAHPTAESPTAHTHGDEAWAPED